MKTIVGNLWDFQTQVKVIPTNGNITKRSDGTPQAVMGAGIALQAKQRWPVLPQLLGHRLFEYGNRLFIFDVPLTLRETLGAITLVTLPTKDDWRDGSTTSRITMSLRQLAAAQRMHDWHQVYLPEPGTGYGGLTWETVLPLLQDFLPTDEFTVVRLQE